MKNLLALATLAVLIEFSTPTIAVGNGGSFQLAQAQNSAQKQQANKVVPPLPQPDGPSCVMDGRYVGDKTTWCVKKQLRQCNAATGQWVNTGKNCGS